MAPKKKMSMKDAYDAVEASVTHAEPKASVPAKTFVSAKHGLVGQMTTCPECGAHFRTTYEAPR